MDDTFATPEIIEERPSWIPLPGLGSYAREIIAVVLVIALADITIYRGHGYAGLAVFLLGFPALLATAKFRRERLLDLLLLGVMLSLIAIRLIWYGSPWQVLTGVLLLIAIATALDGQKPFVFAVVAMASQSLVAGGRALTEYFFALRRASPNIIPRASVNVVLPAAAFVVFSTLFVLANPDAITFIGGHIERFLNAASEWFIRAALRPTEPIFWLAVAWITAGLLKPVFPPLASPVQSPPIMKPAEAPLFIAYRNTLVTVIALFGVYLAYEFFTLWTRDFPEGFYYAGYAHEGAAWLTVALALATLLLSIVFSGEVRRDHRLPRLRLLAWIWSVQNILLSIAVYNRLFIYINFNGMTRMRIVGLFGISVVVVGFLLVVWKIARERDFFWLIQRQVWALAFTVYLLVITPVDGISASYNVRQILRGNLSASMQIGVHQLNLEGVLATLPLLDSSTTEIREGVAARVAERYLQVQALSEVRKQRGWTAYQRSDRVALERFSAVRAKWAPFEDAGARQAAIKRFYDFAYRWY